MTFETVDPSTLVLEWHAVIYKLQVWRPFTTFLYLGPFSLGWAFLFKMMMVYSTVSALEEHFGQRTADFVNMLLFNAVVSLLIACFVNALPGIASLFNGYTVMESLYIFSLIQAHSLLEPNKYTLISGY